MTEGVSFGVGIEPTPGTRLGPFMDRKSAIAAGLPTFFMGSRCIQAGHNAPRRVTDGKCIACVAAEKAKRLEAARAERLKATEPQRAIKQAERLAKAALAEKRRQAKEVALREGREARALARKLAKVAETRARRKAGKVAEVILLETVAEVQGEGPLLDDELDFDSAPWD